VGGFGLVDGEGLGEPDGTVTAVLVASSLVVIPPRVVRQVSVAR
jgi:hypothetical protein